MIVNNTQVSRSVVRADLAAEIVSLQNTGFGNVAMAPPWTSPKLNGHYRALGGDGLVDPTSDDYKTVAFGTEPAPTSMRYGRHQYNIFVRRHSHLVIDPVLEHDLEADGLSIPDDYLRRHLAIAMVVHAHELASRFASTGADRAFDAEHTLPSVDLRDPTESLLAVCEDVFERFLKDGAFGIAGAELVIGMSWEVATVIKNNLDVRETTQGIADSTDGPLVPGVVTLPVLEAFFQQQIGSPYPVRLVVDHQYTQAGNPIFSPDLYFMIQMPGGKGSFVSTPVLDYAPLAGLDPGSEEFDEFRAAGSPLAMVREYRTPQLDARAMFIEQVFGLDFYGSTDPDVRRALGVRVPAVLSS